MERRNEHDKPAMPDILLHASEVGFTRPLGSPLNDMQWKSVLNQQKFDVLRVGKFTIVKKKISVTGLKERSSCIQGNIKGRLSIDDAVDKDVVLVDRRTCRWGKGSFAADGRLEGTAFWLKEHGGELLDGNYLLLCKIRRPSTTIIVMDYFQQRYPFVSHLLDFHAFCKDASGGKLDFIFVKKE